MLDASWPTQQTTAAPMTGACSQWQNYKMPVVIQYEWSSETGFDAN